MQLTKPVSEEEMRKAIQLMIADKAPGPDGLNVGFYKHHWQAIKEGLFNYV